VAELEELPAVGRGRIVWGSQETGRPALFAGQDRTAVPREPAGSGRLKESALLALERSERVLRIKFQQTNQRDKEGFGSAISPQEARGR